jgi:hypothetical protein
MKKVFTFFVISFFCVGMMHAQEKTTLSVKDLNSDIEKYIKKNYEGYNITEAFKYEAFYEMKVQKGDAIEWLLFDNKGNFTKKLTETDQAKLPVQLRTTIATKDVSSNITKYIKKSTYELKESYMYDESYQVKIMKGNEVDNLLFDKEGKFIMKIVPPAPAAQPKTADTAVNKADTIMKK